MQAADPTHDLLGAAALAISAAVWAAYRMEPTEAAALNVVMAEQGISITRLSRILGLSHSATVRVADRLERGGLVTRSPAGHGRTVALTGTRHGKRLARQSAARRIRVLEHATSGLTPAERKSLIKLLAAVVRQLATSQEQIGQVCRLCDQRRCLQRGCLLPA
jgi:MarR family transcriptional regulator, negative regulator of the multidrug operon emrRAB